MDQDSQPTFRCIDIGANLTNAKYKNDLDQVLESAKTSGCERIILTGSSEENSHSAAKICERHPGFLFATAGIHPHDASKFNPSTTVDSLKRLFELEHVVAVGECGLDFNRDYSPRPAQRECFTAHLNLAQETHLPMFLHERDAFDEFETMMKDSRDSISRGVVHCFTGSPAQARAYLDLDLHIGVTGWLCDERRGAQLREAVKVVPANRLMIETDCPYLAPRDYRPKISRNEPKYLSHILLAVAECRGDHPEILAEQIWETTTSFFEIT